MREQCFGAWPDSDPNWKANSKVRVELLDSVKHPNYLVVRLHFESQKHVDLFVDVVVRRSKAKPTPRTILDQVTHMELFHMDPLHWNAYADQIVNSAEEPKASHIPVEAFIRENTAEPGHAVALFPARGVGPHAFHGDERKLTQIERRFQLIGTTSDTMRIWDLRRAVQIVRNQTAGGVILTLSEGGTQGGAVLLASLFDQPVDFVRVRSFDGCQPYSFDVLNLQKIISVEEVPVALAAFRCPVFIDPTDRMSLKFARELTGDQRWPGHRVQPIVPGAFDTK